MNKPNSTPMLSVEEALDFLLGQAHPLEAVEEALTMDALGRVLAVAQVSSISVPPDDNSAMDGYAVRAADLNACGCQMTLMTLRRSLPNIK